MILIHGDVLPADSRHIGQLIDRGLLLCDASERKFHDFVLFRS